MSTSENIVVFDAHMLRSLIINNEQRFPDELQAFRIAFQGRSFRLLLTDGILEQYLEEANKFPPFQVQPTLNTLQRIGRVIRLEEYRLNRFSIDFPGFFQEHSTFILDAIAAQASYFITNYQPWLNLSEETDKRYGFQIVDPARFVELEG